MSSDCFGIMWKRLIRLVALMSCTFLVVAAAYAQLSTASLNGDVKDQQGAVIANATLTLRNVETSVVNTTVSNGSGAYLLQNIPPGRYLLQATAPGFAESQVPVMTLTVGQVATLNLTLSVGSPEHRRDGAGSDA